MKCLLFVAHGSRSFRHRWESAKIVGEICEGLDVACELAYMERLHPTVKEGLENLAAFGCEVVEVLPMFLTWGAHASRDIPALLGVAEANKYYEVEVSGAKMKVRYIWPFIDAGGVVELARRRVAELLGA